MKIYGLQKLTLLDYPGHVAATMFTGGCNLRCPFCQNSAIVISPETNNEEYSDEQIKAFLNKRASILEGICVSGGEPLLQPDIEDFISMIKSYGYAVKLDTNGCFPDKLIALIKSGLVDYVAMDIKNSLSSYPKTVGKDDFDTSPIEKSADFLISSENTVDYEFRTTVVKELHSEQDFIEIGKRFKGAKNYFLQGFVDSGSLICPGLNAWDKKTMEHFRDILSPYMMNTALRGI